MNVSRFDFVEYCAVIKGNFFNISLSLYGIIAESRKDEICHTN